MAVRRRPHRRGVHGHPGGRKRRAAARRARRDRGARQRQGARLRSRLELARHGQPGGAAHRLGARAGRDRRRRRRAGCPASGGGRAGARGRLLRLHGPQDVRADRNRRPLGARRAPRGDVAVRARRPHDPQGHRRADDVERAAAQVRGRHGSDRGGGRARRRDRLSERDRARRDRALRARPPGLRAPEAGGGGRRARLRARRPTGARESSPSRSKAPIRTMSRRCSTGRASRSVRATTATSRSWRSWASRPRSRASFYLYTVPEEIDRLVAGVEKARKVFS